MRQGFRALVIDDDAFSRATAVRILNRLGANVLEAQDGRHALALVQDHGAGLDLIMCDLCMPQLDGIETLVGLAALSPSAGFVLASSADPRLLRAAAGSAERAGVASLQVISKPVTLAKMQTTLATMSARTAASQDVPDQPTDYAFSADDVRRGLTNGEFTTFFQPKVNVVDRRICGAEALIRWQHPQHGLLPAGSFIPIAQANDLLQEIFFVALPNAIDHCARWSRAGYGGGISINLPTAVLGARDLPNRIEAFVAAHGLEPDRVTFEVTEDGWLHGDDLAREVLTRIRIRGFGLSIDDFGTGYSGVQQLLHAPFNELKIGHDFVRAAPVDAEAAIALTSIVALAHQLDLRIVAEGVETQAEWDYVADAGCHEVQGYLISRPLPPSRYAIWLAHALEREASPVGTSA